MMRRLNFQPAYRPFRLLSPLFVTPMRPISDFKNRPLRARLVVALHGIAAAFGRERSFRTQVGAAAAALLALIILRPALIWWAVVAISCALVLGLELMNSALEALVDHLRPEEHPDIRLVKDMAAGGVLIASIGSLVCGVLLVLSRWVR